MAQDAQTHDVVPAAIGDRYPVDRRTVRQLTERLMTALEEYARSGPETPGGAPWLHIHHIPVRRLLGQIVRKLLEPSSDTPIASAPGLARPAGGEGLITTRDGSAREYVYYTVTRSGMAYVLGAPPRWDPPQDLRLVAQAVSAPQDGSQPAEPVQDRAEAVALSWSSRHADTLLPVLGELRRRGRSTLLLDMATDPTQQATPFGVPVRRVPPRLLQLNGGLACLTSRKHPDAVDHVVVNGHRVWLDRLERLAGALLQESTGCTQPSWKATVAIEGWLTSLLKAANARVLLVADDIGPLGALAVHTADRLGITTTNVQHGAWIADSVSRPALQARLQVVMGERDGVLARAWVRHPAAEIHVLGQPRFDALTTIDPGPQRRYLLHLLRSAGHDRVGRIIVLACQPATPARLRRQTSLLLDGLSKAQGNWGLVLAPHPTQEQAFLRALVEPSQLPVAFAGEQVGARGCLAGADAVASVSSTCGLEAMLLGLPVLELTADDETTLGLADHGAALACRTVNDVTAALNLSGRRPIQTSVEARDAICRWRGSAAQDIADLVLMRASSGWSGD